MIKERQEKREKLSLTNDYIFKRVFAKEGNEHILKDFLEGILGFNIEKVEVKNPELPKSYIDDKQSILDIKAHIDDKIVVDIEMQMENEHNIDHRSTVYMSRDLSDQLPEGAKYQQVKKSIVINLLNFNYYKRNCYHSVAHMKFEESNFEEYINMGYEEEQDIATDDLEMHFIELPKFKKKSPNIKSKLDQWLWLFVGDERMIEMAKKENEKVKNAAEMLYNMNLTPAEREMYEARLRGEINHRSAMASAEEIGMKKVKVEIAKKMLEKNMDIKNIAEITGLTEKEIEKIEKEI